MEKVNFRENKKKSGINKRKGVPFVVTYHPKLKNLSKIIKDNLYLLYVNDEVKKTFTPSPMISFRCSRKISSYIVRAELYPLERTVGSCKCGKKRCELCDMISESDTFSSTVTGGSFKINHQFNCNDKCLVHLATCKICNNSTLVRLQAALDLGGITTNLRVENLIGMKNVCKNIFTVILKVRDITVF